MKYSSLQNGERKFLRIFAVTKGLILNPSPAKNTGYLTEAQNLTVHNGTVSRRRGMNTDTDSILEIDEYYYADSKSFILTDCECFYEGRQMKIAYCKALYSDANELVYVYLIGKDRRIIPIGNMVFNRVDDSVFYRPESLIFYSGAAQTGGGIFCFVTRYNQSDGERIYEAYEVDEFFEDWDRVYSYYTPTVLINGRGNMYEQAFTDGQVPELKPQTLETRNMLYGRFCAYYTSDGYSSGFRLPFNDIDNSAIKCKVNVSPSVYSEWTIPSGYLSSDAQSFLGEQVKVNIDRATGTLYFTSGNASFSLPVMREYGDNNIKITAFKQISGGSDAVISSTCCTKLGSYLIFSGGLSRNKLYVTDSSNPLYFYEMNGNSVGSEDFPITALCSDGEKLYAFKKNAIYKVKLSKSKRLNETALLADNGQIFLTNDGFEAECICSDNGCENKHTVVSVSDKQVFMGNDGNVYCVSQNGNVKLLSEGISSLTESLSAEERAQSFATTDNNGYLLFTPQHIFYVSFYKDDSAVYIWRFPEETSVTAAGTLDGQTVLLCENSQSLSGYIATLDAESDKFLSFTTAVGKKEKAIQSKFTLHLDFLSGRASVHSVIMNLKAQKGTEINISGGGYAEKYTVGKAGLYPNTEDSFKAITDLNRVKSLNISVETDKEFSFGFADIFYTETEI